MIIRANNHEGRNNTEYFIVDRQYAVKEGRFDLSGIYWDAKGRRQNQEVPLCFMEIKFALNSDIRDVHQQLARYYEPVKNNAAGIAEEMETIFQQKLALKLYDQSEERLRVMKTPTFPRILKPTCVIRCMSTSDSAASRPLNPVHVVHRFRCMASTFCGSPESQQDDPTEGALCWTLMLCGH